MSTRLTNPATGKEEALLNLRELASVAGITYSKARDMSRVTRTDRPDRVKGSRLVAILGEPVMIDGRPKYWESTVKAHAAELRKRHQTRDDKGKFTKGGAPT